MILLTFVLAMIFLGIFLHLYAKRLKKKESETQPYDTKFVR